MRVSATQDETYTMCPRKWWFLYPMRLPSLMKGDLDFGTVIHSVCERYLLADATGRVPLPDSSQWGEDSPLYGQRPGDAVELYPEGWATVIDKKGKRTLDPAGQDMVKKLVRKAIETGVLERRPGRSIEHKIKRELIPGITMIGKIDVKLPGEIQDHKSTKDMKWARSEKKDSPKYLGNNLQMLDYAYEIISEDPKIDIIRLRHNVYCKNPKKPEVRPVEVTVTRAQVAANWKRLQKQAAKMKALAELELNADQWQEVPGPPPDTDACDAYGGCPFRRVCGGVETPGQYARYTKRKIEQKQNSAPAVTWADVWGKLPSTTSGSNDVSAFEKRKAKQAAKGGGTKTAPAPSNTTIDGSQNTPEAVEPQEAPANPPPWAQSDCPACKGGGFNKKGSACRICDGKSKKVGGPVSGNFTIEVDGIGNISWEAKDGTSLGTAPIEGADVEPAASEKLELPEETPPAAEIDVLGAISKANQSAADEADVAQEVKSKKAADKVMPPAKPEPEPEPKKKKKKQAKSKKKKWDKAPPKEETATSYTDRILEETGTTEEEAGTQAKRKKGGRPKVGYFLYIDCVPTGVATVAVETLFAEMAAEMAETMGVKSYYDLDVFKRREAFAMAFTAEELTERYTKLHIISRNPAGAPDLRAFVDAIVAVAPAGRVIQGLR